MKKLLTYLFFAVMMACVFFVASCNKDKEPANNGIFTVEPVDEEEEEEEEEETPSNLMSWTMRIDGVLTTIDTALVTYDYENDLHVLQCNTAGSDLFTIYLPSLDSALYVVDLDSIMVDYVQGGTTYNGANSPQGVIHLYKNQNNRISANFSARLFNLTTGQERLITDGKLRNIPYVN